MQVQVHSNLDRRIKTVTKNSRQSTLSGTEFSEVLKEVEVSANVSDLRRQHMELLDLGDKIVVKMDIGSINEYVRKVKQFLKGVLDNAFLLNEEELEESDGKRKHILTVEKIDKEVEELIDLLKDGQIKQLNLVRKVNGIHGLVLNIKV